MQKPIEKLANECYQAPEFDYKKFAELIVGQCALAISRLPEGGISAELYYTYCSTFNKYLGIR
jgi:hypothetical protein